MYYIIIMKNKYYKKMIRVYLSCIKEFIDETKVELVNIEEGPMGEDIMTFKCPNCGQEHKSKRFG